MEYFLIIGLVSIVVGFRVLTVGEIKRQHLSLQSADNGFTQVTAELNSLVDEINRVKREHRYSELQRVRLTKDIKDARSELDRLRESPDRRIAA